jgi:SAM-dependent methyltransferase
VTSVPFQDGSFDVAFCQQVLQFVSDPAAALREMRRVLAAQGRAAIAVCRPIEYAPAYVVLAEALGRHAGPEAEALMRSPFPSWSVEDMRGMLAEAGFADVRLSIEVHGIRYPSAAEFLRQEASSSPLAGPIGALDAEARDALIRELEAALRPRRDDAGVVLPIEVYTALARR